jgi:hypothetical protein
MPNPAMALTTVRRATRTAGNSGALRILTRLGLAGYGVLHLAVAWLALQLATGHPAAEGDQSGAFQVLAAQPLGRVLVWIIAIGLVAMAVWQLFEAATGHTDEDGVRRIAERLVSASRTVIYAALAWTAYKVVNGVATSNANQQRQATSGLLGHAGGPWLAGIAGVVVAVVGLVIAGYGVTKSFERRLKRYEMSGRTRTVAALTGQVGYTIKGAVYAMVGVLVVIAAVSFDPGRSTGLDGAMRTLAGQPFGFVLLMVVAAGFAVFGVYCFFQSRYRKV